MPSLPIVNQPPQRSAALLHQLARRMQLASESALAPLGLRPRHLVALSVLRDLDGVTQSDLAATLQLDGTNLVGLLNELEADDLVSRRRSPEDRRRHIVELSDTGRRELARAEFALAAVEDAVLAELSLEDRETLANLLRRATVNHQHAPLGHELASGTNACVAPDPADC
jgi:DNA-binding MarR family transcriptional regulator